MRLPNPWRLRWPSDPRVPLAVRLARQLAETRGWGPADFRQAASFSVDRRVQNFIELEAGGKTLVEAALSAARIRLRPILMTSFSFILGCVPLWIASGSGAVSRQVIGTTVVTGMLAATVIAVFLVPTLFVLFERMAGGGQPDAPELSGPAPEAPTEPLEGPK